MTRSELLSGRFALVTGATRGIGRACAIALSEAGAAVAVGCRDFAAGEALAQTLRSNGARACAVAMNMHDLVQVNTAIEDATQQLGQVDILINNAGFSVPAPALEAAPEHFAAMFDLNVRGAFFASQNVARRLAHTKTRGAIVNIASQAGMVALCDESIYCMTKAAMIHMTRCLASEWAGLGIRVNAVAPTFTRTHGTRRWLDNKAFKDSVLARIPLGRLGEPEDIARPVVFLASEEAAMITGATLTIDGGWTLA